MSTSCAPSGALTKQDMVMLRKVFLKQAADLYSKHSCHPEHRPGFLINGPASAEMKVQT